jgi:small subunit ribosomal protein S5
MADEKTTTTATAATTAPAATENSANKATAPTAKFAPKSVKSGNFTPRGKGGPRGRKKFGDRPKPEFDQKIISLRRVTRVMAGGRRFSFSVAMLIGDKKGRVGLGLGKSNDTTLAINKAVADAKKNMFKIKSTKEYSIPHEIKGKFDASRVWLVPNNQKGIVAGGALRDILTMAGMKNVTAKIHSRSKNHLNNAKATVEALKTLKGDDQTKIVKSEHEKKAEAAKMADKKETETVAAK